MLGGIAQIVWRDVTRVRNIVCLQFSFNNKHIIQYTNKKQLMKIVTHLLNFRTQFVFKISEEPILLHCQPVSLNELVNTLDK